MRMASRVLAALAAAAMLLVGGCATNNPQTAATVGGVPIAGSQVDTLSQALAEASEGQVTANSQRSTVLSILIANEITQQVASAKGVSVTPQERQALLASSQQLTQLAAYPALTEFINRFADSQLISSKVGEEAFIPAAQSVPVEVNPRFGVWDESLGLTGETGSLSTPAETTTG